MRKTRHQLQVIEQPIELALRNYSIIVFAQDTDLRYTWIHNPHPLFTAANVIGKTDADLLPPDDALRLTRIKRRVLEHKTAVREEVLLHLGGHSRLYDLRVEPLQDDDGVIHGVMCVSIDITERKRADDTRRADEERFRIIWETTNDAMTLSDAVIGKNFSIIFPPEQRTWAVEQYRAIFQNRTVLPIYESTIQRKDSSRRIVEVHANFLTLSDRQEVLVSIIRDITERKQAEAEREQLLASEQAAHQALAVALETRD